MDVPKSYRKCGFSSAPLIQLKDLQTDMLSFSCKVCNLTLLLLFSLLVMSNSLQSRGLQHTRLSCSSPSPRVCSNSCPSNHLILCCPLLLLPSIFPSIRVFSKESVLHISGQSIGVSASASVLPMTIQDWFPLGWIGLISLQPKGFSRAFSNTTVQKHQFFGTQLSL